MGQTKYLYGYWFVYRLPFWECCLKLWGEVSTQATFSSLFLITWPCLISAEVASVRNLIGLGKKLFGKTWEQHLLVLSFCPLTHSLIQQPPTILDTILWGDRSELVYLSRSSWSQRRGEQDGCSYWFRVVKALMAAWKTHRNMNERILSSTKGNQERIFGRYGRCEGEGWRGRKVMDLSEWRK